MISSGSGLSTRHHAVAAAEEAGAAARAKVPEGGKVALLFATSHYQDRYAEIRDRVAELTGAAAVVGCTAPGVLTEAGEVEKGPGVAVLLLGGDGLTARPFFHRHLQGDATEVGRALAEGSSRGDLALLFPDGHTTPPHSLLAGAEEENPHLVLVGGASVDDGTLGRALQFAGSDLGSLSLSAVVLGGNLKVDTGISQGCHPLSPAFLITRGHENTVEELEGRPALDVLAEVARKAFGDDLPQAGGRLFVGLCPGSGTRPARGEYLSRNLIGVEASTRSFSIGDRVIAGQRLLFTLRDGTHARTDLNGMLLEMTTRLRGQQPAFGVYMNCTARGIGLYDVPDMDTSILSAYLPGVPLAGIFGGYEMGPLLGGSRVHLYSGVLALGWEEERRESH